MKPIRSEFKRSSTVNAWDDDERAIEDDATSHFLTNESTPDSFVKKRKMSCDCGCLCPPGGYCSESECGALSCEVCHGHCADCQRGACPAHLFPFENVDGTSLRLCGACHSRRRRNRLWKRVGRVLLDPIVDFEE